MKLLNLIIPICFGLAKLLATNPVTGADAVSNPNIILIFTDDQGYQDLGCFGSKTIKTPNLDRMAAEGVRLTSFYAQPVCGVSRAALMTGSYPIRVGEPGNVKRLHTVPHPKEVTVAEVLKSASGPYGDTIEEIDWSYGEILKTLKELDLDDNTLVVFTSDNGPWVETTKGMEPGAAKFIPRNHSGNAEPLRGWKMSAWEGGSRVPFIARWPGKIPAGSESDELLSTMDLMPTFASVAGATPPDAEIDGTDATDFLTGKSETSPRDEYLYYSGCLLTGVRSGSWKLVLPRVDSPNGLGWWGRMIEAVPQTLLFDLKADPGETTNVAADHPEVVAALMKRIVRARTELGDIDQVGSNARFFDEQPRTLQVPIKKPARQATKKPGFQASVDGIIRHSFIAFGQKTYSVNASGKTTWSYPHATRDGYVLANGNIVLTLSKGTRYKGGAVIEVTPDGKETLIWKGMQAEVNSAHPTPSDTFVITEAGTKPRLLEIDRSGKVLVEFPLKCQTGNHHLETRMARKLPDGTYLAPHLLDFAVRHYDANGKVLGSLDTTVPGDKDRSIHTWPFTAIRHGDGHTLVCCTNGNRVVDFDSTGKVVWTLTNDDLPGDWLQDPCGGQIIPNGNVVIASYAGGRKDPRAPKLLEVTRDKKVVWTYADGQRVGIHHFQILDTNGEPLNGPALK